MKAFPVSDTFSTKRALILAVLGCCLLWTGRAETLVYLIGGQSNADGRALAVEPLTENLRKQEGVPFHYRSYPEKDIVHTILQVGSAGAPTTPGTGYGPEISFGRTLTSLRAQSGMADRVALIKYARGGSSIARDWHGGGTASLEGDGPAYRVFQQTVSEGLAALKAEAGDSTQPVRLGGMVWVQGESDIDEGPDQYAANLETFIRDIRATYGEMLPFYLTRLSLNQRRYLRPEKPEIVRGFHAVRQAQEEVSQKMSDVFLIDLDGPEYSVMKDQIHFDAPGQEALGKALAEEVFRRERESDDRVKEDAAVPPGKTIAAP